MPLFLYTYCERIEQKSCVEGETKPTNNSSSPESISTVISFWPIATKVCGSEKKWELSEIAAFAQSFPYGFAESSIDDFLLR